MRSQTYGDKQREAQLRKKQEELWKKSNPEDAQTANTPAKTEKSNQVQNKTKKKGTPERSE
jgi:hypothetical protein